MIICTHMAASACSTVAAICGEFVMLYVIQKWQLIAYLGELRGQHATFWAMRGPRFSDRFLEQEFSYIQGIIHIWCN